MIIAAPLLIPFAKAAGLTIAGLGAIEIGKKVQSFVDNNPEVSSEILTSLKDSLLMTLPGGQGLGTLFKKKASVTLEDVEDMTDEEAADLSKEDKAKIMKEVGKSKGGDKRQRMIDISEKLGLSGEGKEKQTIIDEVEERYDEGGVEDAPKPKFDYKKFFRNRNADGGAIGIEVLFEEKKDGGRIGFANGGENIIGADLKKGPYEQYKDKFAEAFEIGTKYPSISQGPFNPQGMSSDMRHQLGASGGKDTIIDYLSNFGINPQGKFADTVGNLGIGVATALTEIPDAFKMAGEAMKRKDTDALKSGKFLTQPLEDVRSNFAAMNIPYGLTTQEKENLILSNYPGYVPNITTPNYSYGEAAAADFRDGEMLQVPTKTNVEGVDIDELTAPAGPSPFLGSADYQGDPNAIQRSPQSLLSKAIEGTKNVFGSIKDNIPNFGIMGLLNSLDRFDSLPIEDRQFILDQAGGNRPNKDPFGINIRSAFGNYADYVRNKGIFAPGKRGEYYRSLNIPGLDTAMKETVAREQRAKRAYEKQIRDAADAAAREQARIRSITAGYGGSDDSRGATGPTAAGAGMGVGGGYASDYGFLKDGGLATMFTRKR